MSEPRYIQSTSGPGWSPKPLTIVEFLTARLDEDARTAQSASPGPWHLNAEEDEVLAVDDIEVTTAFALSGNQLRWTARHIARHDPAAVLADIAAKRAIIEFHKQWPVLVDTPPKFERSDAGGLDSVAFRMSSQIMWTTEQEYRKRFGDEPPTTLIMRAMASAYADHPDYDPKWKP